ncbi:MAG: hypothetical protein ACC707_07635 [Thiohalomonadales bacterium]
MTVQHFPEFSNSKFLIHIAFHFNKKRLQFLEGVISTICEYPFKQIDLVIDTNDRKFQHAALALNVPAHVDIRVSVHTDLKHPFLLTWAHRENIAEQKNNYDYYMYVEDDIAVSNEALRHWRLDSILLSTHDKIRGFLRSEVDVDKNVMSTDFMKPVRCREMIKIDGKSYLRPKNPYQGFWVYSNKQLELFMSSQCWEDGNHADWAGRESIRRNDVVK